jgi:hypothetical protein
MDEVGRLKEEIEKEASELANRRDPSALVEELDSTFKLFVPSESKKRGATARKAYEDAADLSGITHVAPISGGALSRIVKRFVWKLVEWTIAPLAERARNFAVASAQAQGSMVDRMEEYEALTIRIAESPRMMRARVDSMWEIWEKLGGALLDERLRKIEEAQRDLARRIDQLERK